MKKLVLLTISLANCMSFAETQFNEVEKCGSAKIFKANTCEDSKVELKFDGCLLKSPPQSAVKVACKGNTLTARFGNSQYRYEATFEKTEDGWGASEWKSKGNLRQWQANSEKPKAATAATPAPAAPSVAMPATPPAVVVSAPVENRLPTAIVESPKASDAAPKPTASSLQVSGFVDVRLTSLTVKDQPTWDDNSESGYTIDDGKLALNYAEGATELIVDIPFRRAKNIEIAPALTDYGSNNSTILFGVDKLQFFGKYKFSDQYALWMGQYDTPYGVEFNDSKDRIFSKTGLVYDEMLPVTHTGLLLETTFAGNSLKIFSANSNNKGSLGNSASGDNQFEYGATWGFSNSNFRIQAGVLNRLINKASGDGQAARSLVDLTLGGTVDWFSVDAEIAQLSDPSKNVLTVDGTDNETAGLGVMGLVTLSPWEAWALSFRFENLQNAPSGSSEKQNMSSGGVNIKWKVAPQFETRFEYTNSNFERVDHSKWQTQRGIVSALFSF